MKTQDLLVLGAAAYLGYRATTAVSGWINTQEEWLSHQSDDIGGMIGDLTHPTVGINLPDFNFPDWFGGGTPKWDVPKFIMPTVPEITVPTVPDVAGTAQGIINGIQNAWDNLTSGWF